MRISLSRLPQKIPPNSIRNAHSTELAIKAVLTAVFNSEYLPPPNNFDTITEQPILQPKPKARNIRVIS